MSSVRVEMTDVIVVIGAGSIGQAIVRRVSAGKHVLLADIKQENAESAAKVLFDAGFNVSPATVDVSSRSSVQALVDNPIPRNDRRSSRQRHPMARIGSAEPRCLPQPCHAHRRCTPERSRSGHRYPVSCSVSRVSSPQTAFNPHTFTVLAAYCKSPYPHCSA